MHLRRARRRARAGDVARDDRGLRSRDVLSSLRRREGRRDAAAGADGAGLRNAVVPDGGIAGAARGARARLRTPTCASSAPRASGAASMRPPRWSAAIRSTARRADKVMAAVAGKHTEPVAAAVHRLREVSRGRRLRHAPRVLQRRAPARRRDQDDGGFEPARPGRRGISGRPQMEDRARRAGAAAHGGQHRRGRAGHVQGPALPGARSAPLPRRHADRGVGRRHRRHLRLSARRVRGVPRDPRARDRRARGRSAVSAAAHPSAPRRGRLHLRRRVGDDRVDRRQARHAAPAPAVRRAGRALRAPDARAQHGNALLGAANPRTGRAVVRGSRPARAQGAALVLRVGPRREARRASRAGGHHRPRADRRALRRDAAGPRVLRLSSGRRLRRDPAGVARRRAARFRHAAAARLVHRLGGGHRAVAARPRARCGAQPDAILRRRVVRAVHAVPRRHGEGRRPARAEELGPAAPGRTVAGDGGCVDLRPGAGGAQSHRLRHPLLSRGANERNEGRRDPIPAERQRGRGRSGRDHHRGRAAPRRRDSAPLLHARHAAGRQLPRVHGGDQGRARAGAVVLPRAGGGMEVSSTSRARRALAEDDRRDAGGGRAGARLQARFRARPLARLASASASRASPRARSRRRIVSHPGDGGQSRRLHPVHALRARVPRGAGQRRDRLRVPRRAFEDRVRSRRSDGRVDVRRLRRMRAGVPHRRAGAGEGRLSRADRQEGGLGLPVLRRRLPAHLSRQGQRRSSASRAATGSPTTSGCA